MDKVRVCVDVMGGDEEPSVVMAGIEAALAADADLTVVAVGPQDIVEAFAKKHERVEPLRGSRCHHDGGRSHSSCHA